jgi:hypothetical protein
MLPRLILYAQEAIKLSLLVCTRITLGRFRFSCFEMTHLGINWKEWDSIITASPESLTAADSVKNVCHVLSKAVNRNPQKLLFSRCKQHMGALVSCASGQGILNALVRWGTIKTVAGVSELLLKEPQVCGSNAQLLALGTGEVIKSICERVDDTSEFRKQVLQRLGKVDAAAAIENEGWLRALTGAVSIDQKLLNNLTNNKAAEKALRAVLFAPKKNKTAMKFVNEVLAALSTQGSKENLAAFSRFVFQAISQHMKPDAQYHPRDEVLQALANYGDTGTVDSLVTSITLWSKVPELVNHDVPRKVIHALLSRCSVAVGEKLFKKVVPNAEVAKMLSSSRKASALAIIALGKDIYQSVLSQLGGAEESSCAAVKLAASTRPKFMTTRDAIAKKILAANSSVSIKRSRE